MSERKMKVRSMPAERVRQITVAQLRRRTGHYLADVAKTKNPLAVTLRGKVLFIMMPLPDNTKKATKSRP